MQTEPTQSPPAAKAGGSQRNSSTGRASFFVSLGIMLSRVLGLVRGQVFAHYLGNSDAAAAFTAAFRIPNFLQNLFGEGVLSASFIPVYSRLKSVDQDESAREVAGAVGAILAVVISILVLFGVLLTPWFVDLVAPGFHGDLRNLTVQIVRILFPGAGILVLSAWCLGMLNSHRKFFLSYAAPVLWNVAMIATLVIFGRAFAKGDGGADRLVIACAWGSVIGSLLQLGVQLPFVFRYAGKIRFRLARKNEHVREVFKNLGPVMISRGVVQLSAYIDGMIASFLGAAAVTSIGYAQTLYLLPISLFGMAVAAAELPEMSSGKADDPEAHAKLRARLGAGRRRIAFFVVPSVVALLLLGRQLVAAVYQTGRFGPEDTLYVWCILIGSVVGLLAATWGRLYSSVFYALRDTKTPLRFALVRVALTIGLGLLFSFPLRPMIIQVLGALSNVIPGFRLPAIPESELALGAVGLTSSAGLAGWIEFACLKTTLDRRIGPSPVGVALMLKIWASALAAAGLAICVAQTWLGDHSAAPMRVQKLYELVPILLFGLLYFVFTAVLQVGEMHSLLGRLKRRFKR